MNPKVSICILAFNGAKYLKNCIEAVFAQTYKNSELLIINNGSQDQGKTEKTIKNLVIKYPRTRYINNKANIGFAGGHNQGIRETDTDGEYYLALNQDVILDKNYVKELVCACEKNPHIGAAQGKIKRLLPTDAKLDKKDFEKEKNLHKKLEKAHFVIMEDLTLYQKTDIIDAVGMELHRTGQATNIGEAEYDRGQYEEQMEIFGAAGTVPMYRRKALNDIKLKGKFALSKEEYFDETFFAYKEDIDMAFRLLLRQWKSIYVPTAIAYHERSAVGAGAYHKGNLAIAEQRKNKSKFSKKVSFRNHHYILLKNLFLKNFLQNLPEIAWYEMKMWGYALIMEPYLIHDMFKTIGKIPLMLRKRKMIMKKRKINAKDMEKWFK
ncbi:MAG: glycosyl transferase [uncultured bacterium]|nr:MAG: glycosyl transferase [uncultured bacterium]